MQWYELSKKELIDLLKAYNRYIINDFEPWGPDRQPVSLEEYYENEYSEY